jgi:hypothetical protein
MLDGRIPSPRSKTLLCLFGCLSRHKPANQKSGDQNADDSAEFDIVGDGDEESEY